MIAHCFREKKKRPDGVEKNPHDHYSKRSAYNLPIQRYGPSSALTLTSGAVQHGNIFCLAKSAQYALHDRVRRMLFTSRCPCRTGHNLPARKWRMESAM